MARHVQDIGATLLLQCRPEETPLQGKTSRSKKLRYVPQIFTFGNRCGHDRKKFRTCDFPQNRPTILNITFSKLYNILLSAKKTKDFFGVPIRSELRESILAVLNVLLQHWDLDSCKVGVFNVKTGLFRNVDRAWIAKQTGFLSESRVSAALSFLKKTPFLRVNQNRIKTAGGNFISCVASISLNPALFKKLGFNKKFIAKARQISRAVKQKTVELGQHLATFLNKPASKNPTTRKKVTSIFKS